MISPFSSELPEVSCPCHPETLSALITASMNFDEAITLLAFSLKEKRPSQFSSSWIYFHVPRVYFFFWKNIRTELGDVDWDLVTSKLDRQFQKLWHPQRARRKKPYRDPQELQRALGQYWDKRYVFLSAPTEVEWRQRDWISAILARLSQRGNLSAQEELLELLHFMIEGWVERRYEVRRWRGYPTDLEHTLKQCIRCYRYTGSFAIYLLITLMKAGRGLPYVRWSSLDATILDSDLRKIDSVIQDPATGVIRMAEYNTYYA